VRHNPVTSRHVCGDEGGTEPGCRDALRALTWCLAQSVVLRAPQLLRAAQRVLAALQGAWLASLPVAVWEPEVVLEGTGSVGLRGEQG